LRSSFGADAQPITVTDAEDVEGAGTSLERIAAVFAMTSTVVAEEAVEATVPHHWQEGAG
jgi:hypothetical protein